MSGFASRNATDLPSFAWTAWALPPPRPRADGAPPSLFACPPLSLSVPGCLAWRRISTDPHGHARFCAQTFASLSVGTMEGSEREATGSLPVATAPGAHHEAQVTDGLERTSGSEATRTRTCLVALTPTEHPSLTRLRKCSTKSSRLSATHRRPTRKHSKAIPWSSIGRANECKANHVMSCHVMSCHVFDNV